MEINNIVEMSANGVIDMKSFKKQIFSYDYHTSIINDSIQSLETLREEEQLFTKMFNDYNREAASCKMKMNNIDSEIIDLEERKSIMGVLAPKQQERLDELLKQKDEINAKLEEIKNNKEESSKGVDESNPKKAYYKLNVEDERNKLQENINNILNIYEFCKSEIIESEAKREKIANNMQSALAEHRYEEVSELSKEFGEISLHLNSIKANYEQIIIQVNKFVENKPKFKSKLDELNDKLVGKQTKKIEEIKNSEINNESEIIEEPININETEEVEEPELTNEDEFIADNIDEEEFINNNKEVVNEQVNKANLFENYTMNSSKLDNIESYGIAREVKGKQLTKEQEAKIAEIRNEMGISMENEFSKTKENNILKNIKENIKEKIQASKENNNEDVFEEESVIENEEPFNEEESAIENEEPFIEEESVIENEEPFIEEESVIENEEPFAEEESIDNYQEITQVRFTPSMLLAKVRDKVRRFMYTKEHYDEIIANEMIESQEVAKGR